MRGWRLLISLLFSHTNACIKTPCLYEDQHCITTNNKLEKYLLAEVLNDFDILVEGFCSFSGLDCVGFELVLEELLLLGTAPATFEPALDIFHKPPEN